MFKIGDEVRVRSNGAKGVVSYVEDGYFCVDLDSGAEMDFTDANMLQLAASYDLEQRTVRLPITKTNPVDLKGVPYVPRKGDRAVARTVMGTIGRLSPILLDGLKERVEKFDSLDAFDQVKEMSNITRTPMIVWMGAANMGDAIMRDILAKTMLNNVIDGSGLVGDMLIGRAKRVIAEHEAKNE